MSLRIPFDFISADGYYGNDAGLALWIDGMGLVYMLDVHSNQSILLEQL